jgi:hypothetical protein
MNKAELVDVSIWMSHFDSKFWAKSQIIVEIFDKNFSAKFVFDENVKVSFSNWG